MTPRELITDYLAAAKRGDWATAYGYFADDLVINVPGRSRFAGRHQGKEAAITYIETIRDHYRHGQIELDVVDMLVSDERVALVLRERFRDESGTIGIRRSNVYRVEGGEIVEVSIFEGDQYVVDELVGHMAASR